jgi:hypothetical protein
MQVLQTYMTQRPGTGEVVMTRMFSASQRGQMVVFTVVSVISAVP